MTTLISADNNWTLFGILAAIAALSIWLEQKYSWASKATGCIIALVMAMILSNLRVIPVDAPAYDFIWDYIVPAAIPMLLFKANIGKIWRESGRLLIVFLISGLGTLAGGAAAYKLLSPFISDLAHAVPMMIGTYTGGSVNLVSMADAFKTSGEMVSYSVVADNLIMALYLLSLTAIPVSGFFTKHWKHPLMDQNQDASEEQTFWEAHNVSLLDIAKSIGLSLMIVAVSADLAALFDSLIPDGNFLLALIGGLLGNKYMLITTITVILASLLPEKVGGIQGAHEIGTYLIHIFFAVIGVPASIYLIATQAPLLLAFCAVIVACNMIVSFAAAKLLGFGLEETIIASNANIGGPTTAAAMAIAKGWDTLIVPAILVGTLGYVIGNYYGIFAGTLLGL